MKTVAIVSVGPVQDFIARARKCRDLWFGSWLLSELAKAAAAGILDAIKETTGEEKTSGTLVFPGGVVRRILAPNTDLTVANKIVARVPGDKETARKAAENGRTALQERLSNLRKTAFERIGAKDPNRAKHFDRDAAAAQIDELIEYSWVAVEERETEGTVAYSTARREAERLLQARKNTKIWPQPMWQKAGVPKCCLDGARESVLHESLFTLSAKPGEAGSIGAETLRKWYGVHPSERLCGVGLLKRHGRKDGAHSGAERFFSTSHLAALPFLMGVTKRSRQRPAMEEAWQNYVDELEEIGGMENRVEVMPRVAEAEMGRPLLTENYDGSLLYPQRLLETLEEAGRAEQSKRALAALKRCLKKWNRGEPGAYYAILVGDGDRMGRLIDALTDFHDHELLSKVLADFARDARDAVEENIGSLIYSGGDDVLALLPLHRVLPCSVRLSDAFRRRLSVRKLVSKWNQPDKALEPTFSVGVAVVHHLMPLEAALNSARRTENLAKHSAGRDALAITVHKRAGTPIETWGKWKDLPSAMSKLAALFHRDQVSATTIHELMELDRLRSSGQDPTNEATVAEVIRSEAARILARKREQHGRSALEADVRRMLEGMLGDDPAALGRWLYVAKLLSDAYSAACETNASVSAEQDNADQESEAR